MKGFIDLKKEVFKSLSAKSIEMGVGVISIVILARYLGVSNLGQYFIALAFIQVANNLCSGLGSTVRKRCSEDGTNESEILTISLVIYLLYVSVIFIPLYIFRSRIFELVSLNINFFAPVLIGILTTGVFIVIKNYIAGIGNPGRAEFYISGRSVLNVIVQIVFVLFGLGLYYIILSISIASVVMSVLMIIDRPTLPSYSYETLREIIIFSQWSIPNSFLFILTHRVDVLIIAVIIGSVGVGIYQSAYKLILPATMLADSLSKPLNIQISNMHSRKKDFSEQANKILSYAGIISIPMVFGALVLQDKIMILVFGSQFEGTSLVIILITIYATIRVYRKQLISMIYGIDKPATVFKIQMLYFFMNTPLSVYGAIEFGVPGVIVMTMISEIVTLSIYLYLQRKVLEKYVLKNISYQIASAFTMSVVIFPPTFLFSDIHILVTIPILGLGIITYFVTLFYLSDAARRLYNELKSTGLSKM